MSINLTKGSRVDLTATNPQTEKFKVGLGWNPQAAVGEKFDLDVSVFILNSSEKRVSDSHIVFYNNLSSPNGFVTHTGDNRTGDGDGDDEVVIVDFSKATSEEVKVVFVVTIDEAEARNQNFGQVNNAFIRICDEKTGEEILKYDLGEDFSIERAVTFGELYKKDDQWKFKAIGTGMRGGLQQYVDLY